MVRVQNDSVTIAAANSTLLAGIVVSFVYCFAPFDIFALAACNVILMALVYVSRPFGFLRFFGLLFCGGVCKFGATGRTVFSQSPTFYVFRHRESAVFAQRLHLLAAFAYLEKRRRVGLLFSANFADDTATSDFGGFGGGTGKASRSFRWLTVDGDGWSRCSASRAGNFALGNAIIAHRVLVFLAALSTVLESAHATILPQLPGYVQL